MFQLEDLRKTRVWQEALEEGVELGEASKEADVVRKLLASGMSAKEIATRLKLPISRVRQFAKSTTD